MLDKFNVVNYHIPLNQQKAATEALRNTYPSSFLVDFHVFENSDSSREVFVVSDSLTTVA